MIGLLAAALAWAMIVATGNEPRATILAELPGGVSTEMVVGALLGALGGAWLARRYASVSR